MIFSPQNQEWRMPSHNSFNPDHLLTKRHLGLYPSAVFYCPLRLFFTHKSAL